MPQVIIGSGDVDVLYWVVSLQYAAENWTFTSGYMREPIEWRGFAGSMFDGMSAEAGGNFFQAAWRAREDVELMFRFADRADRSGKHIQRETGELVPAHSRYSKIFTVGARWDLSSNFMLRAEYQRHNGTFVLSSRENPIPSDMDPD